MKRNRLIQHNGKFIYYMDFSGLKNSIEISQIIKESQLYVRAQPMLSVYTITNIKDMHFNGEVKELFSGFIKGNKPFIKGSALIGTNGLQQIVINGIMKLTGREIRSFGNEKSALDWLTTK